MSTQAAPIAALRAPERRALAGAWLLSWGCSPRAS